MKEFIYFFTIIALLSLSGCKLSDKIATKTKEIYQKAKEKYGEYRGGEKKPKPFTVIYQDDPSNKQILISSACSVNNAVNYVYYQTPADTIRVLGDTQHYISYLNSEKPYWDIRYVNPVSQFIDGGTYDYYPNHSLYTGIDVRSGQRNIGIGTDASKGEAGGSITQSKCIDGVMAGGVTINLFNAPDQYIDYGGPQSTFTYQLGNTSLSYPWKSDGTGNLAIQSAFDKPIYLNYADNVGGSVSFGVYLKNKRTGVVINYIIGIYAAGTAWREEKRSIQFDPTTKFVHVGTVISDESWWSTSSPNSKLITEIFPSTNKTTTDDGQWPDFFRVNIAYQNLKALLNELNTNPPVGAENYNFGNNPTEWAVTAIVLQYELDEKGGKATFSGSFKGLEAYISQFPI